jgi:uncharacterized damage-inducible protein DinB
MPLRDLLLAEFDHEIAATRRLLACVPDAALGWRPHERARTMGQLAAHITEITGWSEYILDRPAFDLDATPAPRPEGASGAALLGEFLEGARRARGWIDRTDGELTMLWSLKQNGQEIFSLPRAAAFRAFVLGHIVHHRGQLSVYLRMNDLPMPALYGPTADVERAAEAKKKTSSNP